MRKKWYLKTWVICLFCIIFPIIGIILIILQHKDDKKLVAQYGSIDMLDNRITTLNEEYNQKNENLQKEYDEKSKNLENNHNNRLNSLTQKYNSLMQKFNLLQTEYDSLNKDVILKHYDLSDYDGLTSEECKNKITLLKIQEKELIKSNNAVTVYSDANKSVINNNLKQILRCFNTECDNILMNLSVKNIDNMRGKISKSFESINKIFKVDGLELNKSILELKLEELNLVYTYEIKREQEREYQKEIKAQMIEEEKVRREIEQEKKKIEKDQAQFTNEINKLMKYLQKTSNDTEKQLYIDKVKELEEKLKELEKAKETVLERGANAKAGFVYIISNIGSFGEDVYKIGMTRRLEPMDRIKELSSASVPFEFDVHAMIFSDDAPDLEAKLHKHFQKQSINRVNPRKEFFRVALDEIEQVVKENFNNTVEFTRIPVAKEYRQSLTISQEENTNI
ncbi:DUF4041 domain-containing protein [Clostridium neonatale]|uniref:DUF4041 domain-containing protein n=1 Tax=Clostridium neonatale TaxID=137838 RepID=UPI00291BB516|nr:DUF4041 domain-containing protein [Clostridium neonatale]CAI3537701.1 DUF4041 domain-containing protein [Clostridium neonatale]CAI3605753.1 DUF4041 domain-containing protein [Clostridium neonatale]CAI3635191.1 DUF4041 domain-containing protein [Clostridium neonatale]CAI3636799.1 DUF4041 domain-containing protein [Clostridium neonatale]CAI3637699.1 DUF4041 domain-containing protein [Clostridium neonatale]